MLFGIPSSCSAAFFLPVAARGIGSGPDRADCGLLYAISTAWLRGAAGTGFYLLGSFGANRHLRLSGGALLILACVYFAASRQWRVLPLAAGLLPLVWTPLRRWRRVCGRNFRTHRLGSRQLLRSACKVVEYQGGGLRTRELTIDGLIQGRGQAANRFNEYAYLSTLLAP